MLSRLLATYLMLGLALTGTTQSASAEIADGPTKPTVHVWEPCAFDIPVGAADELIRKVAGQGYTQTRRFTDSSDDTSYHPCTRADWDALDDDGGILLVDTHGGEDDDSGFVTVAWSRDGNSLFNPNGGGWADADSDGQIDAYMFVAEDPDEEGLYYVAVTHQWFDGNWVDIVPNNAIVAMCACYSARGIQQTNSVIDNLWSRTAIGYVGEVGYDQGILDIDLFFGRMNGQYADGEERKALAAYVAGGFSSTFRMVGDPDMTLCPAPADCYPGNDGTVNDLVGTAWINFDSFLDSSQPASQALTVTFTGACEIWDIHFHPSQYSEDPLCRSRQLRFCWRYVGDPCHPSFTITATAHAQYIHAWGGGGQQMDADGINPNGGTATWSFHY